MPAPLPVFDGHNDALLRLFRKSRDRPEAFYERAEDGHLDLPRAEAGGFKGGMFACFVPSPAAPDGPRAGRDTPPLPPLLDPGYARDTTLALAALLVRVEAAGDGRLRVVRDAAELRAAFAGDGLAAVFHIEGADGIDPGLDALEVLYAAGLRSLGIVWSRPNAFGHGVPFRFPSSPDTGPGLTDAGRDLVRACNRLGVLIDLSHLNEKGFWDVAGLSDAPLVASHSNAHALCPTARNLTDDQIAAIRESDGLVGVNFASGFLREDGRHTADTPIERVCDHVDHLVERLGVTRVGFGSDFDGATIPAAIGDAAGLPRLIEALRARGYDEDSLRRIASENWLDVLERTWRA